MSDLTTYKENSMIFYWTEKNKKIFKLFQEGKSPEEIAEDLKCQKEKVLEVVNHPAFVSRFNQHLNLLSTRLQAKRLSVSLEALDLLWSKAKETIDKVPSGTTLRQLSKIIEGGSSPQIAEILKAQQSKVFKSKGEKKLSEKEKDKRIKEIFGYEEVEFTGEVKEQKN